MDFDGWSVCSQSVFAGLQSVFAGVQSVFAGLLGVFAGVQSVFACLQSETWRICLLEKLANINEPIQ